MQLHDEELFVLDTLPTDSQAHLGAGPRKRQRAAKGKRQTRAAAIIAASGANTQPFGSGTAYAPKRRRVAQDTGNAKLMQCALVTARLRSELRPEHALRTSHLPARPLRPWASM